MIVIVKDSARPEQIEKLKENFESMGLQVHFSKGMNTTLLGLVGDTTSVDIGKIASLDIVEEVKRIQGRRCQRCEDRRRKLPGDCRPLLGRDAGADLPGGRGGQKGRRWPSARRRV